RQTEYGAVDESDAECRVRAGLDHVAFFDVVALVQNDRDAIADRGGGSGELGDVADDLVCGGGAAGLAVLNMTGERVYEIAGQMSPIGRCQRRALLALEVIVEDQLALVLGQDQVDARPLEVRVEKQLRVGNDDRVCGNLRMR